MLVFEKKRFHFWGKYVIICAARLRFAKKQKRRLYIYENYP